MIKNIIFDVGGVLVDFHPEKTMKNMGFSEEEAKIIAKATTQGNLWAELDRGALPKEEVFERMYDKIREITGEKSEKYISAAETFLSKGIFQTVTPFPYAANWLSELKNRGFKIYILSNYPSWLWDYHWQTTFTFTPFVDDKIVSGKIKLIKPDPRIYQHILKEFSLVADECVFIDDRTENIEAAKSQGIHGIIFTDFETTKALLERELSSGQSTC